MHNLMTLLYSTSTVICFAVMFVSTLYILFKSRKQFNHFACFMQMLLRKKFSIQQSNTCLMHIQYHFKWPPMAVFVGASYVKHTDSNCQEHTIV